MLRTKLLFILPLLVTVTAQLQTINGVEYSGGTSNVRYQRNALTPRVLTPVQPVPQVLVVDSQNPVTTRQQILAPQPTQSALVPQPTVLLPESTPLLNTISDLTTLPEVENHPNQHVVYVPMWVNDEKKETPAPLPTVSTVVQTRPTPLPQPIPQPIRQPVTVLEPRPTPTLIVEPAPQPRPVPVVQPPPVRPAVITPAVIQPVAPITQAPPILQPVTYQTPSPVPAVVYPTRPVPAPVPAVVYPTRPLPDPVPAVVYPTRPVPAIVTQRPSIATSQILNFVCDHGDGYYSVSNECDTYIECKSDVAIKHSCLDGLHFNPAAKRNEYPCSYPSEVQCMAGASEQIAQATNECPRQYGLFSTNDGECSTYISCDDGLATVMHCPLGLVFNTQTSTCDWPINVPQCNPAVFADLKCPDPPIDEFGVISDIVYKYRYRQECSLYVGCEDGYPRLLGCDYGLAFDEASQSCIDASYVTNCERPR